MFDASYLSSSPQHSRRTGASASVIAHVGLALIAYGALTGPPSSDPSQRAASMRPDGLVWMPTAAAGGGGGGGGDRTPTPGSARVAGRNRSSLPPHPPVPDPFSDASAEPTLQTLAIAAVPMGSAMDAFVGLLAPANEISTRGSGDGASAGPASGASAGDGRGLGSGPGDRGGSDGDVYGVGNGVSTPQPLREVKPNYTSDAVRAKIQGVVVLECVVRPDGRVGDVKVLRSLDARFGLDEQAVDAARQWLFAPGRRLGQPVAVRVVIELGFRLR
jgi:protein TonB